MSGSRSSLQLGSLWLVGGQATGQATGAQDIAVGRAGPDDAAPPVSVERRPAEALLWPKRAQRGQQKPARRQQAPAIAPPAIEPPARASRRGRQGRRGGEHAAQYAQAHSRKAPGALSARCELPAAAPSAATHSLVCTHPLSTPLSPLSLLSLLSHSPSYAKLTVKVSVNFTQTTSKIYEFFNRPFGNHASDISANLSSPDDFSGAVKLVPQYQLVRPPVFDFESVNRSLPKSIPIDYPPLGRD